MGLIGMQNILDSLLEFANGIFKLCLQPVSGLHVETPVMFVEDMLQFFHERELFLCLKPYHLQLKGTVSDSDVVITIGFA